MEYDAKRLADGRWGIYQDTKLLETIGCEKTCREILSCLRGKSKKKPRRIDLLSKGSVAATRTRSRSRVKAS